ncbi:MAG: DNA-directed RNA polymerase subunit P [Candidatus ainarchaeum sp.]|nr:DNA-directed RNA polymerase subunit P [Candidatus ainarchaeum sp.]MDD3975661.1 DNA-directed RNA polymerase subunit P [Candidatus ainarchaeum sp.]
MYYCSRCKTEFDEIPENNKCSVCGSRTFYKKRFPIIKKIKAY